MPYLKLDIPCAKRQINFEKKNSRIIESLLEILLKYAAHFSKVCLMFILKSSMTHIKVTLNATIY